ncbi:tetraspanin-9-like isoform X2 [Maniola hyperantus]|uniref:tetraspanin-9-like isoform X2 n=1 Tax=Aphantopus hyperantus TaxID=2795564 RepID=UPI001568A156|nr:tetraspanin-9-like [Maniola hyperantus]
MKVPTVLKSVKYSLAAVNCLFLVTGLILLTVGLIVLTKFNNYDLFVTKIFFTVPNFAIATAGIIFFTTILGFYGAISEQFYFIAGYVALLVTVLIFEISITVLGFELQNITSDEIGSPMSDSMEEYGPTETMSVNIIWDNLQMGFQCCGLTGVADWILSRAVVPVSCCRMNPGTISPFECTTALTYRDGCQSALSEWLGYNAYALGVTAAFVTCLQVLIIAAAAWLAYRSKYEEVELER